jgi:CheY-like chemotaxis protein
MLKVVTTLAPSADELGNLKREFLASLNHEMRTPLSGILGMADLLLETALSDEQLDYVGAARGCAENLLEVLNATLEYSALSADRVTLEEADFAPRELLAGIVAEFAPKAAQKGLRLAASLDEDLPETVSGDALRLRQLLSHLVNNAVKFTAHGGVDLVVKSRGAGEGRVRISIEVRDTGIGIAPERLECIFDSFRQLESGLARRFSGLGLGLAVARKLADLMQAELSVESGLGQGSAFTVAAAFRLSVEPPASIRDHAVPGRARKVLVVDDNEVSQRVARRLLEKHSYSVECAESGPAAVQAAGRACYDLVLMDLQMPLMDGVEAATAIRALPGYAAVPIIALTANCSDNYRELCSHGFDAFLPKPVQSSELLREVNRLAPGLAKPPSRARSVRAAGILENRPRSAG